MAPPKRLYAWANPAFAQGAPYDHTWVTSYDNNAHPHANIAAVRTAHEDYWYCWGSFHARGTTPGLPNGALGSQVGDINFARCLVASNADSSTTYSARGTIFTYGVDGVCHQLANQALYATGVGGTRPLTVARASGYKLSSAIYGAYGLQHSAWRSKIAACAAAAVSSPSHTPSATQIPRPRGPGPNMSPIAPPIPPDEFEEQVSQVLGAKKLAVALQLLNLRAQFQAAAAAQAHILTAPTAAELNARNQRFLDDAAKLLSKQDFINIFGVEPGTKANLVLTNPTKERRAR